MHVALGPGLSTNIHVGLLHADCTVRYDYCTMFPNHGPPKCTRQVEHIMCFEQFASMLRTLASRWNEEKFRCYEMKIEESEKANSHPGIKPRTPLACAASALPLSYSNQTTTNHHNIICICLSYMYVCNTFQIGSWEAFISCSLPIRAQDFRHN